MPLRQEPPQVAIQRQNSRQNSLARRESKMRGIGPGMKGMQDLNAQNAQTLSRHFETVNALSSLLGPQVAQMPITARGNPEFNALFEAVQGNLDAFPDEILNPTMEVGRGPMGDPTGTGDSEQIRAHRQQVAAEKQQLFPGGGQIGRQFGTGFEESQQILAQLLGI